MNGKRLLLISAIVLFVLFMLSGFGSLANQGDKLGQDPSRPSRQARGEENESSAAPREFDDQEDPDLPSKFQRQIDKESYLRARDEYVGMKRGFESGYPFDPRARQDAIQQMDRQEKNRRIESLVNGNLTPPVTIAAGAWTPLGPSPLPNGVGSNPVSGRVTSVVVDPTNSSKVYLGTAQGGVWRSLDGGSTWTAIFDSAQSLAIGALALAPSNP